MGCDIHLTVERKVGERWICTDTLSHHDNRDGWSMPVARNRNYERFAALAGVRGEGPKPSGVPENISQTTRYLIDHWGPDGHSHGSLPMTEAARIFAETQYGELSKFQREYPASYYFNVEDGKLDQYRIVFWFDN